jgi:hypothetical protein
MGNGRWEKQRRKAERGDRRGNREQGTGNKGREEWEGSSTENSKQAVFLRPFSVCSHESFMFVYFLTEKETAEIICLKTNQPTKRTNRIVIYAKVLKILLKVHMHEIFLVRFYTFFCIFQSLIGTKHSTTNSFKYLRQIRPFKIFYYSLFSLQASSITEHCHRNRRVKFSIVFVIVRCWILLSVFGKKVESNFAFSVKLWC